MFLGPAIISGRLAAQSIAAEVSAVTKEVVEPPIATTRDDDWQATMTPDDLEVMLSLPRDGYWHFQVSHELVLERSYPCSSCHSAQLPFSTVNDSARLLQTSVCTTCH
jgi:hypothetical protein